MSIFKKFNDLFRSNLNDWLDKAEDPKKLHAQKIIDVEANRRKAHRLLLAAMASLKLAQKKQDLFKKELLELTDKSDNSSLNTDISSEKNTLKTERELELESKYKEITDLIKEEQQSIEALNRGLKALDDKIRRVKKGPAPQNQTRNRPTGSAEMPDHVNESHLFDEFDRMEEKIEANEAEAEAFSELMASLDQGEKKTTIQKKESPEAPNLIDELAELKKKLKND